MKLLSSLTAALLLSASIPTIAEQPARADAVQILQNGSRPSRTGDPSNFVGSVRLDPLFPARMPSQMSGGSVTV
jgi:hypothetical protein